MFRITRDPSSGSFIQCLAKITVMILSRDRTINVILAKHFIELPDDGSLVIRNMLEQFQLF
jgi:hypothetical protein